MVRAGVTLNLTVTVGAFEKVVSEQGHEGHEKYANVEIWGQSCRPAKVAVRPACLRAVGCAEGTGGGQRRAGRSEQADTHQARSVQWRFRGSSVRFAVSFQSAWLQCGEHAMGRRLLIKHI